MMKIIKSYSELITIPTFEDRFEYLKCGGSVGIETFGGKRYLNQVLYRSSDWRNFRREIIIRDNGKDLACEDVPILGSIYIHHINPITIEDVLKRRPCVFDPENVISCSFKTHEALHYSNESPLETKPVERKLYDTCPWKNFYRRENAHV